MENQDRSKSVKYNFETTLHDKTTFAYSDEEKAEALVDILVISRLKRLQTLHSSFGSKKESDTYY